MLPLARRSLAGHSAAPVRPYHGSALRRRSSAVTNSAPDPLIGRTIGQYHILDRIGGGGMGIVYTARASRLGRVVALKFLPSQWSHDETAKQRLVREAQAASATNHPHICTIHDIETADDGQLFIVMAYYEGETLKKRLESGPLPIEEALDIATQVADGLAKAHAQSVVHRDIKPGNLMLTEDGVRILDFGLATFADTLKLTAEHAPIGTVAYMSPEQVRGLQADPRSDVWAVGAVLYEMLTGHPPFRGSHAEAVSHAIRNEPPIPTRSERPEVPEEVEQLVFRALHKETSVRYANGRELARALRMVRGESIPLELRTAPVAVSQPTADRRLPSRRLVRTATAVAVLLSLIGAVWLWPVERVPVAVVPVANLTGYDALTPFMAALTLELERELEEVAGIQAYPYERLIEIIRPFRTHSGDSSSREAIQAIATFSGARVLIVPTILREGVAWKAALEFRDPSTGASERYETSPVVSSLMKEAVYGLIPVLTNAVSDRFATGPSRLGRKLRQLLHRPPTLPQLRMRSLDAVADLEKGLDAYERQELHAAKAAFASAADRDSSNPLPLTWQSRIATLMRRDREAVDAATQAERLLGSATRETDRWFVQAVNAEARRDRATAGAMYQKLVDSHPHHAGWLMERAGFEDRQGRMSDAVASYHAALALDGSLIRPHVELCRLYTPTRMNEPALAKQHAERALTRYSALGNESGQAQARWCLADVLRTGTNQERLEAKQHAGAALKLMEKLGEPYGLGRAYNYVALVEWWLGTHRSEAAALWENALGLSRQVGNVLLESRILMNLGVAHEWLGHRDLALKYYGASYALFEASGNEQDAASSQVNAAAIHIHFGPDPDQGLRDTQNALAVFQKLGDKNFEVFARLNLAAYHRNRGHWEDAIRELTLGETLSRQYNLGGQLTRVLIDVGSVRLDSGDYLAARELFQQVIAKASGADRIKARILLAQTNTALGEFAAARDELDGASRDLEQHGDTAQRASLWLAEGRLAYESGLPQAQESFRRAAEMWTPELPMPSAVEARAYLGMLDAVQGKPSGMAMIEQSRAQARRMRRVGLEVRCQMFLARVDVRQRRFDSAVARLGDISVETQRVLAPELRAQLHYWRSQAFVGRRDRRSAIAEGEAAAKFVEDVRLSLREPYRERVLLRSDFRLILGMHVPAK
jgi:tetratricopeptide (TPR) repeat protein